MRVCDFQVESVFAIDFWWCAVEMAVSWSFALLLILTLVALVTFSQPLFQSTPAAEVRHTRKDLEIAPPQNLPAFTEERGSQQQQQQQQLKTREATRRIEEQGICRGKRKAILPRKTISSTPLLVVASERHPPAAPPARKSWDSSENAIPRRSVSAHFESDRMVPTGPNPLHNSNRSQVIYP